jgi:chromosome partitioning protein
MAGPRVISVINMKGGVGKTTITANIFRLIFRRRAVKTLTIDMDPQFNLTQMLMSPSVYSEALAEHKTILTAMEPTPDVGYLNIRTTDQPPPSPKNLVYLRKYLTKTPEVVLDLLPGTFGLVKYSLATDMGKLSKVESRFQHFIDLCKANYGLVVLDCNPSSSFLTQCALRVCSDVVVPVHEDAYSKIGLQLVSQFIKGLGRPKPPGMFVVINEASRSGAPSHVEQDIRKDKEFGPVTLANRIYRSQYLVAKANYVGDAIDRKGPYHDRLVSELIDVADELADALGVKK